MDEGSTGTTQHNMRGWIVVIAACLVMFAPTFAQMQMSPIAASLMQTYGIDQAQYMSVFTAPNLAPVFLSFIAGILLDRFGSKRTVLIAIILTTVGCIGRILAAGFVPFYCTSVMIGVASSFIVTGSTKVMAQYFPVDKIGLPVGILYASSSIASLIAIATTAYFSTVRTAFIVSAAVAVLAVLFWMFAVPYDGKQKQAEGEQPQQPRIGATLKRVLTCRDVYFVLIGFTCLGVMGFTLAGMLPTALASRGMSTTDAGLMTSMYTVGALLGSVIMPAIISRIKNEKALLCILTVLLIAMFPCVMAAPLGIPVAILLILIGIVSYGLVPIFMSLPVRFPKVGFECAGTAGGLVTTIQAIGIALMPSNILIPLAAGNYMTLFLLLSLLGIITLACAIVVRIPPRPEAGPGIG